MRLDDVLHRQAGLITLAQARACGISRDAVGRRVRSGAWHRVRPGVYLVAGHRRTDEVRIRAAMLWAGADALLSGPAAAYWHGMSRAVGGGRRARRRPGAHRAGRRDRHARRVGFGGPGLAEARPVPRSVPRVLPDARLGRIGPGGPADRGGGGPGRLGRRTVARAAPSRSRGHRMGGWPDSEFGPYLVDIAFPDERVAVEVDGWAWHVDVERFRTRPEEGQRARGVGLGPAPLHLARPHLLGGAGGRRDRVGPAG